MRRRDLIALLGGASALLPLAAAAQKAMPVIGFLGASTPDGTEQWVEAFRHRLQELGWAEGKNVLIDYQWAKGRADRIDEIAARFANRKVDVIVTYGTVAVAATKSATASIPIVFAGAGDPVGTGLVASLAPEAM